MSVSIAGTGWITPLGSGVHQVWKRLLAGEVPQAEEVRDGVGERAYLAYRVPQSALKDLPPHPRLRRASAISRFAAAAGLAALKEANIEVDETMASRFALIFAVADGGVVYTKRFYSDIVNTGADTASPLLFPETVFNAAASHLAAIIGLTGVTYTLVGDGTVGLAAIKMGEDLMADTELDYCLVVAAEEADWLLCDAYQKWRLLRSKPPLDLFSAASKGTMLSEGAGAVLLGRTGPVSIAATAAGTYFATRREAPGALAKALKEVHTPRSAIVIGSANGTFIDSAEAAAVNQVSTDALLYSPKASLGEGIAATGVWQVIVGTQVLQTQELPPPQYRDGNAGPASESMKLRRCDEVTVLSCGLGQQSGAIRLVKNAQVRPDPSA
jgi:3-oxoacyl-(acyl-carrier-protein) synthase